MMPASGTQSGVYVALIPRAAAPVVFAAAAAYRGDRARLALGSGGHARSSIRCWRCASSRCAPAALITSAASLTGAVPEMRETLEM
jgi:hypothetical protein